MKRNRIFWAPMICAVSIWLGSPAFGQSSALDGLSVKVNPGSLVYYGDLSTNNANVVGRIFTNSKFGIGASLIKQFNPFFGIQAQFMAGSLYNKASDNTYFMGALNEFSLSARFDPLNLMKGGPYRFSPYLTVGVGTFGYRSVRREIGTNVVLLPDFGYEADGATRARMQTAMSMPVAIGLSYKILPNLQVEAEHCIRFTNTDLLDCYKGAGTSNDLYSLTSVGVRYTLPFHAKANRDRAAYDTKSRNGQQGKTEPAATIKAPAAREIVECNMPEKVTNGQVFVVKIRINKGTYQGPGKLIQKYPDGFEAMEDLNEKQGMTFTNQTVVVDWEKMPADTVVVYQFLVKAGEKLTGQQNITGRFEYGEGLGASTARFNRTLFVENNPVLAGGDNEEKAGELADQAAKESDRGNIRQSQSKPGIEFRVQIGAFRENSKADQALAKKHHITEIIQEESIDGWYKYTVGSFPTYNEAVRYRDAFIKRTGIVEAFIVAYRDGKRLAKVSDALK